MKPKVTTTTTTPIEKVNVSHATNCKLSLAENIKRIPLKYRQFNFVGVGRCILVNVLNVMMNVFTDEDAENLILPYINIQV